MNDRGRSGEEKARKYLAGKGHTIVATGFRSRFGEIDIITECGEFLVFVEVKSRRNASFAYAREHVGKVKQRKLIKTANYWLLKNKTNLQPRFDVVEIYSDYNEIIHIENAFGV